MGTYGYTVLYTATIENYRIEREQTGNVWIRGILTGVAFHPTGMGATHLASH
ncbi:hypothetical protein BD309DRAFT_522311 [Dichomitus squalens]|nr:hypothetical protein BD309DRAFT_522311 [Dichomitus squalens]